MHRNTADATVHGAHAGSPIDVLAQPGGFSSANLAVSGASPFVLSGMNANAIDGCGLFSATPVAPVPLSLNADTLNRGPGDGAMEGENEWAPDEAHRVFCAYPGCNKHYASQDGTR